MVSFLKRKSPGLQQPSVKPNLDAVPSWYQDFLQQVERFWVVNSIEPASRSSFLLSNLLSAIEAGDKDRAHLILEVALQFEDAGKAILLCEMLLIKQHYRHQELVRELQFMAEPSAVPYLVKALTSNLDHMDEYNGSGSGVVAKWFSHALLDIGTPEAIDALRAFSNHSDAEVREEMTYRLTKLKELE